MNEFLRTFVMKTINEMIDNNKLEWEVRKFALDWFSKGIITEEDLQEIDDRYKQPEETVEETVEDTEEKNESEEAE